MDYFGARYMGSSLGRFTSPDAPFMDQTTADPQGHSVTGTGLCPAAVTLIAMIASFGLLSVAMHTLPLGTAYTVWTGIGAVGAFLVGVLVLGEPAHAIRLLAAGLIIAGIVLKKSA